MMRRIKNLMNFSRKCLRYLYNLSNKDSSLLSRPWWKDQFYLEAKNPTTGNMPSWMHIHSEEALKRYLASFTLLNPILYPATYIWDKNYISGYYDSKNQRGLFPYKLKNGEDETVTIFDYNFLLLCDQENELEWKQNQRGDLVSVRAYPVVEDSNGKKGSFGRIRLGNNNPIGQVREDGICYIPTLQKGVIRVSDFEILMFKDDDQQ